MAMPGLTSVILFFGLCLLFFIYFLQFCYVDFFIDFFFSDLKDKTACLKILLQPSTAFSNIWKHISLT